MSIKKKKRIRKTSQITVLNDGMIVDSMESNSPKDAPTIRAVNEGFLSKNNPVLANGINLKGEKTDGSKIPIAFISKDDQIILGSYLTDIPMLLRSKDKPIWHDGEKFKKFLVEGDAALGDTLPVGSGFLYTGEDPIPENYEVATPPFSNPNLLINSDFQVWQRGTVFNNVQNGTFCADRWRIYNGGNSNLKIEKVDNGLKMSGNEKGASIYQPMDDSFYTLNAGKLYTFSYSLDGVVYEKHGIVPKTRDNNLVSIYRSVPTIFNWAKLELGEIATPLISKSYAQELLECMRYYTVLEYKRTTPSIFGYFSGEKCAQLFLPLSVCMRKLPTILYPDGLHLLLPGLASQQFISNVSVTGFCNNGVSISGETASQTMSYPTPTMVTNISNDYKIILDAEIY